MGVRRREKRRSEEERGGARTPEPLSFSSMVLSGLYINGLRNLRPGSRKQEAGSRKQELLLVVHPVVCWQQISSC